MKTKFKSKLIQQLHNILLLGVKKLQNNQTKVLKLTSNKKVMYKNDWCKRVIFIISQKLKNFIIII
jgi:hypothetical protein